MWMMGRGCLYVCLRHAANQLSVESNPLPPLNHASEREMYCSLSSRHYRGEVYHLLVYPTPPLHTLHKHSIHKHTRLTPSHTTQSLLLSHNSHMTHLLIIAPILVYKLIFTGNDKDKADSRNAVDDRSVRLKKEV